MTSYRDILIWVKARPRLSLALKLADVLAVLGAVCAYLVTLGLCAAEDVWFSAKLLLVSGVPFVVVSAVRRIINAPRPYELLCDVYELPPKKRQGCSFPSRHVFSAFSIGTALCFVRPMVGIIVIALGLLCAVSRVLLGKHFLRDVVAGAIIGAVTSVIGMIIMI